MTQLVTIENILWEGPHGGAVFNGFADDGKKHRFVAGADTMPRAPLTGEVWTIGGHRKNHPKFGPQIGVKKAVLARPSGKLLCATLQSKRFPGIGPAKAQALWDQHGEKLYDLLDANDPDPFIEDFGNEIAHTLIEGWSELNIEADVYRYLDRHGIPIFICRKLINIYGTKAIEKLDENPYRLLAFLTWKPTDRAGRALGVSADDPRRLIGAVEAAGYQRLNFGHTWTDADELKNRTRRLLGCDATTADHAIELALADNAIVETADGYQGLGPHAMERFIRDRVQEMSDGQFQAVQKTIRVNATPEALEPILSAYEASEGFSLNDAQHDAVLTALSAPVSVITGGAGVGKTTVLKAIHAASESLGGAIIQMALAGRAAMRMAEATARPAMTIASFFNRVDNGNITLDGEETIVIDEASMLDLPTMYRVLRRMEPGSRLVLVGDPAQLPPIGFGLVFHAIVEDRWCPVVELSEVHRQAASTGIPQASLAIRNGTPPELPKYAGKQPGVTFIECDKQDIVDAVLNVIHDLGHDECQVVGAVKNGVAGTRTINEIFHGLLAPGRPERVGYAEGEPVLWTVNDYELGLMNGNLGTVAEITNEGLRIDWDGDIKLIDDAASVDMDHAYAITCHKAQGSQFPRVVIPVFRSRLLDRTLLYTATTRAQNQVVLIGDRDAFNEAIVSAPNPDKRSSGYNRCRLPR